MDHFRALYKNSSILSPKRCKRTEARDIRAHKRSELYTSMRNISPSPRRNYPSNNEEQKENSKPQQITNEQQIDPKANAKISRQKAHLLKFLAWKTEKARQAEIKEKSKRAPFITSTRNCSTATFSELHVNNNKKSSFAPPNHIFHPPSALQNLELKVIGSNSVGLVNAQRKEVFNFVATPKKKANRPGIQASQKPTYSKPAAPAVKTAPNKPPISSKTPLSNLKVTKPQPVYNFQLKKLPPVTPKSSLPPVKQPSVQKPPSSTISASKLKPIQKPPPIVANKTPLPKQPLVRTAGPRTRSTAVQNPPPSKPNVRSRISPQKNVFAKPKSTLPPIKRPTFKAPKKTNSSISNAVAAVAAAAAGAKKGKTALRTLSGATKLAKTKQVPETPTDPNQEFAFLNVVTSTKRKSISAKESSSANSLLVQMDKLVSPVDDSANHKSEGDKFNFLRYSAVQSDEHKAEEPPARQEDVEKTPDKPAAPQTPTTYLSPYVSVSRGKVGIKTEREKRNSLYLSLDKSTAADEPAETTATIRHTLGTVHYYRKQLKDEIARLNEQCDNWQQYKDGNAELVEDSGSDMINVTIGQTKLLTTKKLKQFGDLIDRCEDGVMGKKSSAKGEGAKPILPEDLEGFWSMVGLQIENVDKRFANLQRWKENNWKDPDEVPPKPTKSSNGVARKVKKRKPTATGSTAGPNKDLQKILRNAQAAFLRKKTANSGFEEDIILTPSKNRQILIRDRRSRSAAATIITVNTPKATSRKSITVSDQTTPTGVTSEPKLLPHINNFRKSMNLLKSTLLNKADKKSPALNECPSPQPVSRKSILKTPGSIRRPKSVIFNSPTLQFTMEDKVDDDDGDGGSEATSSSSSGSSKAKFAKHAEEERTYTLRNRHVKLRDSSEFIIPR